MIPADAIAAARDKSILDVAKQCGAVLKKVGGEWNGPCPVCGGRDRFWVDEGKNLFLCRMSGTAGDPIRLIRYKHGSTFAEAVEMLTGTRALPVAERRQATAEDDNVYREKARRRAYAIWQCGKPIEIARGGHLVVRYLALRGIAMPGWRIKALREIDQLAYWHRAKGERDLAIIHKGPAMLAAITGPDGRFIGVHRTWLDLSRPNGKAMIVDPDTSEPLNAKKVEGSQRGGKIVLRDGEAGGVCALGEGIETVLSWAELQVSAGSGPWLKPALWCGINLDNIAGKAEGQIPHPSLTATDSLGRVRRVKIGSHEPDLSDDRCLQVPADDFEKLILLGDGDSDRFATQAAMLRARNRFELCGHDAAIDWAPDGKDWNDVLKERSREARQAGRAA